MKRLLISSILVMLLSVSVYAKNFDRVFNEYRKVEGSEYIHIPGWMMRIASRFASVEDALPGQMHGMKIITLDGKSKVKREFNNLISQLSADYDLIMHVAEGKDNVKIWAERQGNTLKNVYIYVTDDEESVFVKFSGKFKIDQLKQLAAQVRK